MQRMGENSPLACTYGGFVSLSASPSRRRAFSLEPAAVLLVILFLCLCFARVHAADSSMGTGGQEGSSALVSPEGDVSSQLQDDAEAVAVPGDSGASPAHSVSGVVSLGGKAVSGMDLTLSGTTSTGSAYSETATTDAEGRYAFDAPPGKYTLKGSHGKYALKNESTEVTVDSADTVLAMDLQAVAINLVLVYYHHDMLGSTVLQTDDSGAVVMRAAYQPFGDVNTQWSADSYAETHLYTGKEYDETGLYNYGARYYNPAIGRFMSIDPAGGNTGDPQTWNRYVYCENNPYRYLDPNGRWNADVHFIKTQEWAKAYFTLGSARILAEACNDVDGLFSGTSYLPGLLGGDQSYHFNTGSGEYASDKDIRMIHAEEHLIKAIGLYKQGDIALAFVELGIGLHPLQDVGAHTDKYQDSVLGVYLHWGEAADEYSTEEGKARLEGTRKATEDYFGRFCKGVGIIPGVGTKLVDRAVNDAVLGNVY
jgi:RHS repeat-associated protein